MSRKPRECYRDQKYGAVGVRVDFARQSFGQLIEAVDENDNAGNVGACFAARREIRRRRMLVDGALARAEKGATS